jgi:hypothetical protein
MKTNKMKMTKEQEDNLRTLEDLGKDELPYTSRRKIIYKGKMAPKGYFYIVIKADILITGEGLKVLGKKTREVSKLVKGGISEEVEREVCNYLYLAYFEN